MSDPGTLAISTSGRVFECDEFFSGQWHYVGTMTGLSSRPMGVATGGSDLVVVTANGDTYSSPWGGGQAVFRGNIFSGAPTASTPTTWGKVKADYRK